jgi:lactose/L-arabinose transport system substrate-binding protein
LNEIYGKDIEFYQKILQDRGAVGSLLAARSGAAYEAADPFFGGEKVWQNFSDWLAKVPSVNYGVFTNEADLAVTAQLPALTQGMPVDDALKAIESEISGHIQ